MQFSALVLILALVVAMGAFSGKTMAAPETNDAQTVTRAGTQASYKGPAEYFTGNVRVDPLFPAKAAAAPFSGVYVTLSLALVPPDTNPNSLQAQNNSLADISDILLENIPTSHKK